MAAAPSLVWPAARGVRHALLQLLELVGHLILFRSQTLRFLLILEPLSAEARILAAAGLTEAERASIDANQVPSHDEVPR